MADDSKSLEFKISSTFDGSGTTKAADSLDDLTKGASKAAESTGELKKATDAAGDSADEFSLHGREVNRLFLELDRVAPGLGEAMRAAFHGPLGAIVALVAGLAAARSAFDAYDEKLEKILGEDLTGGIDRVNAMATAFDGVARAVQAANAQYNSAASVEERALKNIEAELTFTRQLIQAQKDLALAKIAAAEAAGQISPEEAAAKRAQVEGAAKKADFDAEQKALQAELTQKANAAANAKAQADAAAKKAAADQPERDKADAETMAEVEKQRRESGEASATTAAQTMDASVSANTTPLGLGALLTEGFWKFAGKQILEHGLNVGAFQTGGQAAAEEKAAGKSDIDIANANAAEEGRLNKKVEQAKADQAEVERTATEATKAQEDYDFNKDPNNAGGIAAKIAQNAQLQAVAAQTMATATETHGAATVKAMDKAVATMEKTTAALEAHAARIAHLEARVSRAANNSNGVN